MRKVPDLQQLLVLVAVQAPALVPAQAHAQALVPAPVLLLARPRPQPPHLLPTPHPPRALGPVATCEVAGERLSEEVEAHRYSVVQESSKLEKVLVVLRRQPRPLLCPPVASLETLRPSVSVYHW